MTKNLRKDIYWLSKPRSQDMQGPILLKGNWVNIFTKNGYRERRVQWFDENHNSTMDTWIESKTVWVHDCFQKFNEFEPIKSNKSTQK